MCIKVSGTILIFVFYSRSHLQVEDDLSTLKDMVFRTTIQLWTYQEQSKRKRKNSNYYLNVLSALTLHRKDRISRYEKLHKNRLKKDNGS